MKIDEATGLPELPEGHFWRVTKDSAGPLVQIRKKRIVGSTSVSDWYFFPGMHDGDAKAAINSSAESCFESWYGQRAALELFGDYPPNKLG